MPSGTAHPGSTRPVSSWRSRSTGCWATPDADPDGGEPPSAVRRTARRTGCAGTGSDGRGQTLPCCTGHRDGRGPVPGGDRGTEADQAGVGGGPGGGPRGGGGVGGGGKG